MEQQDIEIKKVQAKEISESDILSVETPIEIPSDTEIEKFAFDKYHNIEDSRWFEPLQVGAKWMREQILKQTK